MHYNLLLEEMRRSANVGVDVATCGCVLRMTHGLPCAREIVQYRPQHQSIPLLAIHLIWQKLNDLPQQLSQCTHDPEQEISFFRQKFDEA